MEFLTDNLVNIIFYVILVVGLILQGKSKAVYKDVVRTIIDVADKLGDSQVLNKAETQGSKKAQEKLREERVKNLEK